MRIPYLEKILHGCPAPGFNPIFSSLLSLMVAFTNCISLFEFSNLIPQSLTSLTELLLKTNPSEVPEDADPVPLTPLPPQNEMSQL